MQLISFAGSEKEFTAPSPNSVSWVPRLPARSTPCAASCRTGKTPPRYFRYTAQRWARLRSIGFEERCQNRYRWSYSNKTPSTHSMRSGTLQVISDIRVGTLLSWQKTKRHTEAHP